jgi:hypothetical protein
MNLPFTTAQFLATFERYNEAIWVRAGVIRLRLSFRLGPDLPSLVGGCVIVYAVVVYPIIGALSGHGHPLSPSVGVAPCPTTIFSFGLLFCTRRPVPMYVLVIPLAWSLIGLSAALSMGIREDVGLTIAGVLGTALIVWRDRRPGWGGALRWQHA